MAPPAPNRTPLAPNPAPPPTPACPVLPISQQTPIFVVMPMRNQVLEHFPHIFSPTLTRFFCWQSGGMLQTSTSVQIGHLYQGQACYLIPQFQEWCHHSQGAGTIH